MCSGSDVNLFVGAASPARCVPGCQTYGVTSGIADGVHFRRIVATDFYQTGVAR